ncbi:MAG TPA: DUF4350 domain-containing protein [Natronosporangium sp.]|nr:DUF4350 domain-containing protein [Natronosporangium sp.]
MSTTIPFAPTPSAAGAAPVEGRPTTTARRSSRWRQRWYRLVTPLAVAAMLIVITLVARGLEEPDLGEAATLHPHRTDQDGSSALADLLTERGATVTHVTDVETAFAQVDSAEDAVLFVAKPSLMGSLLAAAATQHAGIHRVVLVMPNKLQLQLSGMPFVHGKQRWATGVAEPGCEVPEAVAAGRAAVVRNRYVPVLPEQSQSCYGGGLVRWSDTDRDVFVVGGAHPFLNRRLGEYGNADLALGLLGGHREVIWVDALSLPVDLRLRFPELPSLEGPERSEMDRSGGGNPLAALLDGYPPGVTAGLLLALLLAVLVAVVRARRLGPPVSEPLPVVVPATEVVAGRGRLYQVTHARPVALAALREAALRRILPALGLPLAPPPTPETVVAAAAERTGLPPEQLRQILYEREPHTDDQLTAAVAELDAVVELLTRDNPAAEGGAS